jgi:hypothetical protein
MVRRSLLTSESLKKINAFLVSLGLNSNIRAFFQYHAHLVQDVHKYTRKVLPILPSPISPHALPAKLPQGFLLNCVLRNYTEVLARIC